MNLKDLLIEVNIGFSQFDMYKEIDGTYELLIQHNENFAVTNNGKTIVNKIEVNHEDKSITLKFEMEKK